MPRKPTTAELLDLLVSLGCVLGTFELECSLKLESPPSPLAIRAVRQRVKRVKAQLLRRAKGED